MAVLAGPASRVTEAPSHSVYVVVPSYDATIKWIAFIKFALLPNKHRIWTLLSRDLSFLRRATVASFPNVVVETDDVGTDQNKDI